MERPAEAMNDTFASRLRANVSKAPAENIPPLTAAPHTHSAATARNTGTAARHRADMELPGVPSSTGMATTALLRQSTNPTVTAILRRPSKVIFAPRSGLRNGPTGETVNSLMCQYGLKLAPAVNAEDGWQSQDEDSRAQGKWSSVLQAHIPVEDYSTSTGFNFGQRETGQSTKGYVNTDRTEQTPRGYAVGNPVRSIPNPNESTTEFVHSSARRSRFADVERPPTLMEKICGLEPSQTGILPPPPGIATPMSLRSPPPVDTAGRRGAISIPTTPLSHRREGGISAPSGSTGVGHYESTPFSPEKKSIWKQWYAYEEETPHDEPEGKTLSLAPGTPVHSLGRSKEKLTASDDRRLFNLRHRQDLVHRLETLELCKRMPKANTLDFNEQTRKEHFTYEKPTNISNIDGSGFSGRYCLSDLDTEYLQQKFTLDVLRPKPNSFSAGDPEHLQEFNGPGKAQVPGFTEGRKDTFASSSKQTMSGETSGAGYEPGVMPNPHYGPRSSSETDSNVVFTELFRRLVPYWKHIVEQPVDGNIPHEQASFEYGETSFGGNGGESIGAPGGLNGDEAREHSYTALQKEYLERISTDKLPRSPSASLRHMLEEHAQAAQSKLPWPALPGMEIPGQRGPAEALRSAGTASTRPMPGSRIGVDFGNPAYGGEAGVALAWERERWQHFHNGNSENVHQPILEYAFEEDDWYDGSSNGSDGM